MADKKTVLVVGGGYGGITVAQLLDNDFNVFVIDRKDYFMHTVGALRAAVMPDFAHNVTPPYAKALKNGTVVSGEVARVDGPSIQLTGNDTAIAADFVVIATGSSYAFPEDTTPTAYQDARIMYSKAVQALAPDERVLVVGGGPAGCELAGEIKAHYPQKSVTLVSRSVKLIGADYPDKLSSRIKATMESMGIVVKTGVAAECAPRPGPDVEADAKPVKVPLSNGEILEVDRIFFCIGYARTNNSCFEHTIPVSETGHIKVNEYLQVEGQTHVFAIGDCCNADKYEFTFLATKMAHIAAQNIKALARGKPMSTKYSRFKPSSLIFVSLGSSLGASVIGGCTWGNFVTRTIKSKQLLCQVYASALNVEYPDSKDVDIPKPDAFLSEKGNLPQSVLKALRPGPSA